MRKKKFWLKFYILCNWFGIRVSIDDKDLGFIRPNFGDS